MSNMKGGGIVESKKCFVIGPIGKEMTNIRKHADKLFDNIIRPILEDKFKYTCKRGDKIFKSGYIDVQLIKALEESDVVTVDLSFRNPNAYLELGICFSLGKPVIPLIRQTEMVKKELPFDIEKLRVIDFPDDIKKVSQAKEKLEEFIKSVEEREYCNPISDALAENLVDRALAEWLGPSMKQCKEVVKSFMKDMKSIIEHVKCRDTLDVLLSDRLREINSSFNNRRFHTKLDSYPVAVTKALQHLVNSANGKPFKKKTKKVVEVFATSLLTPKQWYEGYSKDKKYLDEIKDYKKSFEVMKDKIDLTRYLIIHNDDFRKQKTDVEKFIREHNHNNFHLEYVDYDKAEKRNPDLIDDFVMIRNYKETISLRVVGNRLSENIELEILDDKAPYFDHLAHLRSSYNDLAVDAKEAYKTIFKSDYKRSQT